MENDEETAAAIVALLLVKGNKKKRKRSVWVKPWLGRRTNLGLYEMLVQELRRWTVVLFFFSALRFFVAVFINYRVDIPYAPFFFPGFNKRFSDDCFCHG